MPHRDDHASRVLQRIREVPEGFVRAYAQFIGIDPEVMVTAYLDEDRRQQARTARTAVPPPTAAPEEVVPTRSPGTRFWFAALVIALILVVLAAGLTALGYGPLASRFKPVRTSTAPASAGVAS